MIESIRQEIMSNGRRGGTLWFHPRACVIPGPGETRAVFMTGQGISGSDYFHPVHWLTSTDLGRSWSAAEPIPGFGRTALPDGTEEGVCDVVPGYHSQSGTVLAMGHNVFYRGGKFFTPQPRRWPVYAVHTQRLGGGRWLPKRRLEWDNPEATVIYTCGCAQRHTFGDGTLLIPLSFGSADRPDRRVCTVVAQFDGEELRIVRSGSTLELRAGRGLLEPSLARHDGSFYLTIRAEDCRGYVSRCTGGLSWSGLTAWAWDDGEPLEMSTTQQHWLTHSDALFLVYTRKAECNVNVMRWRAPLFISRVDTDRLCLIRESERVAVELTGDGINDPEHVARLGNFHCTNVTPEESWVTVGECIPADGYRGDTIVSRIAWTKPNRLVGSTADNP